MERPASVRPAPVAAIVALVGGGLLGVGSFMTWAEVTGGGTSVTASGTDGSDGYITLGAGVVLLLIGILWLVRFGGARKLLAVIAILAGLLGAGLGLYDAVTAKDSVLNEAADQLAAQFGEPKDVMRSLLDKAVDAGQIDIAVAAGLYVVIAGGVLGIVGGILGFAGARAVAPDGFSGAPAPGEAPSEAGTPAPQAQVPDSPTRDAPAPPAEPPIPRTPTEVPAMPVPPAPPPDDERPSG
jgi:hypothetical protein